MKAQKKPVIVDYFVHDSSDNSGLLAWIRSFGTEPDEVIHYEKGVLKVDTLEGSSYAVPDKYVIIRGIKGEFYPCEPNIFELTYDKL